MPITDLATARLVPSHVDLSPTFVGLFVNPAVATVIAFTITSANAAALKYV